MYLGGYWNDRYDTLDDCVRRLDRFLSELRQFPAFDRWYSLGSSRAAASQAIGTDADSLRGLLLKGVNRRDLDGRALPELGYQFGAWSHGPVDLSLIVQCGGSPRTPAGITNSVVISIPDLETENSPGVPWDALEDAMRTVIQCWDPEWATCTTQAVARSQLALEPPVFGWLTYLRGREPRGSSSPSWLDVRAEGAGWIIRHKERDLRSMTAADALSIRQSILLG